MPRPNSAKWWRIRKRMHRNQFLVGCGIGILFEECVERILGELKESGKILDFKHNLQNSLEDHSGKDFTVVKEVNGISEIRSFGVTISAERCKKARKRYPDVPQFWFPRGSTTNPLVIKEAVLSLFL